VLPTLDGKGTVSLASCPGAKCLTVYVAPWCGVCRASSGLILALGEYLKARGIETRVVVGKDRLDAVREYARTFGPKTLLDPDGGVGLRGGVPQFIVTDPAGKVLKAMPGVPGIYQPPYPDSLLKRFADYLNLT